MHEATTMTRPWLALLSVLMFASGYSAAEAQIPSSSKKKAAAAMKKSPKDSAAQADTPDSAKAATPAPTQAAKADPKVWDNYDFVPGSRILFYTDFSEDKVGNFARGVKYVSG